jgi:hypothetical protein
MPEMEILRVTELPIEASKSAHDRKKQYKWKIQDTISKLYEELDREKCENSIFDFSPKRYLRC